MFKRILVTGSAGFIGFHTALALKKRGDAVLGIDNFNDYYSPELKKARAKILLKEGIETLDKDICDESFLESLFSNHSFDGVIHLAAQAGVRYSLENPNAYLKSNLHGFLSLLEALKKRPHIKLVYASSSSVYGTNTKIPFSIDDCSDHPANFYAATKKANELMAYTYHHLYKIPMIGLRFFTVYGPWGRPDMAYFIFTEAIKNQKPIFLNNQGNMQRDFTYIDDVVRGTIAAMDYPSEYEIFNLGNCTPIALLSFVEILEKLLGKKAEKIFKDSALGEVETTFADIKESSQKLNFFPKTPLEEGLKHFVKWHDLYQIGKISSCSGVPKT